MQVESPLRPKFRQASPIPTDRERRFIDCLAQQMTHKDAYRVAWDRPDMPDKQANIMASRIKQRPRLQALLAEQAKAVEAAAQAQQKARVEAVNAKGKAENERRLKERLLTINERLTILANIALAKTSKPSDKARAIDVYTKIAGGYAPTQHELSGPNGAPIQTESTVEASVTVTSVKDRLAIFKAKRDAVQPQGN